MQTLTFSRTSVFAAVAAAALLAGCASNRPPVRTQPEPSQPSGQVTPLPPGQRPQVNQQEQPPSGQPSKPLPPSSPKQISSPAVMALMGTADKLARAGHFDRSAATLQRALNIEPRNPFVYQRLAAVRLAQGQYDQAETMAQKSNSLAVGNPFVQANNWVLIAQARQATGNSTGQQEAKAKVHKFRTQSAALR